jgi:hypothetical protein
VSAKGVAMNSIVLDILKVNRKRFTAKQFDVLKTIASHPNGYDYRKGYESKSSNIYYLPANKQAVEDKLKPIGLTMMSIPANDGSRRKLYPQIWIAAQNAGLFNLLMSCLILDV